MKTKIKNWIYPFVIMGVLLLSSNSWKKKSDNNNPTPIPIPITITDIDGNVYHAVTIGTQVWMVENLKTTKYNDGTSIPLVTDNVAWSNLTTPGYCWYNNDIINKNTYGALYNWFTVNTGRLAPTGWHIPTDAEWTMLVTFLGNEFVAGGKMKEANTFWVPMDTNTTNSSGFTALPGGVRHRDGSFITITLQATFWSATESSTTNASYRKLYYNLPDVGEGQGYKTDGFSVRCLKD